MNDKIENEKIERKKKKNIEIDPISCCPSLTRAFQGDTRLLNKGTRKKKNEDKPKKKMMVHCAQNREKLSNGK